MKNLIAIMVLLLSVSSYAKQSLVFLINTTERDQNFGKTAPYLDEYYDRQVWQKMFPQAKIITIRSDTNQGIRQSLENWMQPDAEEKEVQGLFVSSHGNRLFLANEKKSFKVLMPRDLDKVFAPIRGHMAPGARLVFGACSVTKDMTPEQAHASMSQILSYFGGDDVSLYANSRLGLKNMEILKRTNFFNSDISLQHRALFSLAYLAWPIALPVLYIADRLQNQGYLLEKKGEHSKLYQTTYFEALHPNAEVAKSNRVF